MAQWLGLRTYTAGGTGSISGQGIKIPHAAWPPPKKKYIYIYVYILYNIYIIKFTSPLKYRDLLMKI